MSEHLEERIEQVVRAGLEVFNEEFEDFTARLNVITIYANDTQDYKHLKEHLDEEAQKLDEDFYTLNIPLTVASETIALVRLAQSDGEQIQIGECDFALDEWLAFESKHKKKKWIQIDEGDDFHVITYADPEKDVVLAFTNPPIIHEEEEEILYDDDADSAADE
jgi:hypothetical protein